MLRPTLTFTPIRATPTGKIAWRKTTSELTPRDRLGGLRVRWNIGRDDYRVTPGLYASGDPGRDSPVLVTANYKLTFDSVRKELKGLSAWLLVLDTKGVNVWCAAGKGTFGTEELVRRIRETGLTGIVDHRNIVAPQLGATGVAGFAVTKETGFRVHFGPVYARDLPAYLASGMTKTGDMARVRFGLRERLAVAPVEFVQSLKFLPAAILIAFLFALPAGDVFVSRAIVNLALLAGAFPVGTILFPALLPFLPFRAFSAKGAVLGLLWGGAIAVIAAVSGSAEPVAAIPAATAAAALISYLAMNFTGSTTFTCQKGAELEVRCAVIPQISAGILGTLGGIALIVARLLA
jgi:hypothetical protein